MSSPQKNTHQLHLLPKLRQRSVVERVKAIDWNIGSKAPMVVELDPTTACNLACPDCISRDLLNQGFFSRERLRSLTTELVDAGVKAVILIGGGEPLAHPEIGWLINYLGEHDVRLGLTTNGLMLKRYLEPISKYGDWVRVSMDAGTAETFQRIRPSLTGKSAFDEAVENMEALAAVRTGKLGYSFMIYSEGKFDVPRPESDPANDKKRQFLPIAGKSEYTNVHEIFQAAKIAKEIGCDYFEVKPMYDINHYAIRQPEGLIEVASEQIAKALEVQTSSFRVLQATKLQHVLRGEGNIEPKEYTRCAVSELRTLITPSGVYVCPYFRGVEHKKIGNVHKTDFQEMWKGAGRAVVMEKLNPSLDCRMHCIRHESNVFLEDVIEGRTKVEVIDDFDMFI